MKKKISIFLRIAVKGSLLFFLIKKVPYKDLFVVYKTAHKGLLLGGFLTFLLGYMLGVMRWKFFLRVLGLDISYPKLILSFVSSLSFNLFCPSIVAGDIFRTTSIGLAHSQLKKVASSVLIDRFSGSFALVTVATVSYIFGRHLVPAKSVALAIMILISVIGGSGLIIFNRRIFHFLIGFLKNGSRLKEKVIDFHDQLYFFRENPKIFLKSFIYSLPIQLVSPVGFFILARGFGLQGLNIVHFFILVPILMGIALIPITIGGFGLRENAAVSFFGLIGLTPQVSTNLSLINGAVVIFMGLCGGLIYVSVYHRCLQSDI